MAHFNKEERIAIGKCVQKLNGKITNDLHLVLVGREAKRDAAYNLEIQKAIATTDQVKWLHYVETKELQDLVKAAQTFVFPSLSEGFGLPMIEAFSAGVPVIASNNSLAEIGGKSAILVDAHSTEALAHAILIATKQDSAHLVKRPTEIERFLLAENC